MNRTVELLRLVRLCGRIEGRKKLQKMVHILRVAGFPFEYRYSFHYHGPFSAELKGEIDEIIDQELAEERSHQTIGSQFPQYVLMPGRRLDEVLRRIGADDEPPWTGLAKRLNSLPAFELEAISTILFLQLRGFAGEALRTRFRLLKPGLTDAFESALREAEAVRSTARGSAVVSPVN